MTVPGTRILHLLALTAIVLLNLAAYSNTFRADWQFDDYPNIVDNYSLHIDEVSEFEQVHNREGGRFNRIFCFYTFAFNHLFHGLDVGGYHLTNILIHIAAAVLLYMTVYMTLTLPVFKRLPRRMVFLASLFTALLWGLSPVQTQAITYLVQRLASLSAMLYLLAFFLYIKGRRCGLAGNRKTGIILLLSGGIPFILALLTKEHTLILPGIIFLYEFLFIRREKKLPLKPLVIMILILALTAGFMLALNPAAFEFITTGYEGREFSLPQRLLTEMRVLVRYLTLMIWPHPSRLNIDYNYRISTGLFHPWTTFASMLFLLSSTGLAFWLARRDPLISFAIFWYLAHNLIESSFIPLELIFEHRMYLPSMWVYALLTILCLRLFEPDLAKPSEQNNDG